MDALYHPVLVALVVSIIAVLALVVIVAIDPSVTINTSATTSILHPNSSARTSFWRTVRRQCFHFCIRSLGHLSQRLLHSFSHIMEFFGCDRTDWMCDHLEDLELNLSFV
jgi:hypothetical protein